MYNFPYSIARMQFDPLTQVQHKLTLALLLSVPVLNIKLHVMSAESLVWSAHSR